MSKICISWPGPGIYKDYGPSCPHFIWIPCTTARCYEFYLLVPEGEPFDVVLICGLPALAYRKGAYTYLILQMAKSQNLANLPTS